MKPISGPPMTLGNAAAAYVRLIACASIAAIKPSPTPTRWPLGYGAETPLLDWRKQARLSPMRWLTGQRAIFDPFRR